jgi:AraC family transcriptional regulator
VIYREMPPIWDQSFRALFYECWGRENAVISATARKVEYPEYEQLLSLKAAFGGVEEYFIDGQRVAVDDDTFLILNAGRRYASRIFSSTPVHSFSIFFRRGLAEEVANGFQQTMQAMLDSPLSGERTVEFDERLREHESSIKSSLVLIQETLDAGVCDQNWLDEQLYGLLARMLGAEHKHRRLSELIPSARRATRLELHRRLGLATKYIHTFFRDPIGLRDMALAANLSPFHFLRIFKAVFGITPSAFLNRKRTLEAKRLIDRTSWTMTEIAVNVGFGSRTSLFRHLKASESALAADRRVAQSRRGANRCAR